MERKLTITNVTAARLPKRDSWSDSDLYVRFIAADGSVIAETPPQRNIRGGIARWPPEAITATVKGDDLTVRIEVWDKDRGADDIMGRGAIALDPSLPKDGHVQAQLSASIRGRTHLSVLSCVVELDPPLSPPPPPAPPPPAEPPAQPPGAARPTPTRPISYGGGRTASESRKWDAMLSKMPAWCNTNLPEGEVVVRKELRHMPAEEQERFARACLKMRENGAGPGTSPYFQLAALHGGFPPYPRSEHPSYCSHGRENFPGWHRPYLLEFERMLRRADVALGNDGRIGLPYWGWEELEVNGEVAPAVVRRCVPAM